MDSDDFDLSRDFRRAVLFDRIDPAKSRDQAWHAAEKVAEHMAALPDRRSLVTVMQIGTDAHVRYHVDVMVEDPLPETDAPPEYMDGIYVSVSRINSLDAWLDKNERPRPRP